MPFVMVSVVLKTVVTGSAEGGAGASLTQVWQAHSTRAVAPSNYSVLQA